MLPLLLILTAGCGTKEATSDEKLNTVPTVARIAKQRQQQQQTTRPGGTQ